MGRRQIDAIIREDPVMIVFNRRERIDVHGGGWRWGADVPQAPQQVTLIPFKRRMVEFLINTELGNVPDLPYVLLGRWNLNIQEQDWFTYGGEKFTVQTIDLKREIRIAAHVDYFGKTPAP
jgi:hypothetical protein